MEKADRFIYKTCPFVAGGIFIGSVYWTAVTYGAVTVMQVYFFTVKFLNFRTPKKLCCTLPKIQTKRPNLSVFYLIGVN